MTFDRNDIEELVLSEDGHRGIRELRDNQDIAAFNTAVEYLEQNIVYIVDTIDEAISSSREDGLNVYFAVSFSAEGFPTDDAISNGLMAQVGYDDYYDVETGKLFHAVLIDLSTAGLQPIPEGRKCAFMIEDAIYQIYHEQHYQGSAPSHRPAVMMYLGSYEDDSTRKWYPFYDVGADGVTPLGYFSGRPDDIYNDLYGFWVF